MRNQLTCHNINIPLYITPSELKKIQQNAMQTNMTWEAYLEHTTYKAIERMIKLPRLTKPPNTG